MIVPMQMRAVQKVTPAVQHVPVVCRLPVEVCEQEVKQSKPDS